MKRILCLISGYLFIMFFSRIMAYRQIGGQAGHRNGRDVSGGQARSMGGQASARYTSYSSSSSLHQPAPRKKCSICSYNQIQEHEKRAIYHKYHYSSKYTRECSGVENSPGEYFCPPCKAIHSSISSLSRLKICVSASALHEFWAPRGANVIYEGDKNHIEYITIPGAKIIDLVEAWKIEYFQERRPMDVLVVAGLNNLVQGYKPDSLLRDYDYMVQTVMHQAKKFHPEVLNTCAIATLYYPPQLCWFPDQGMCPPGYVNHLDDMWYLNHEIERLNLESGLKVPNFTTFGLRVENKSTKDKYGQVWARHTTRHRYEHWREPDPSDMLHLNDSKRIKMGRQVNRYFEFETGK